MKKPTITETALKNALLILTKCTLELAMNDEFMNQGRNGKLTKKAKQIIKDLESLNPIIISIKLELSK